MYKNIYKFALISTLMAFSSISYSANTIQMNGSIVEDTCSVNQNSRDCEILNRLRQKIETQSISRSDLRTKSQKNNTTEITIEQLSDQKSAVILATYY